MFTSSASPAGVASAAATLTVTPRQNIRETCGTSYGPSGFAGAEFCYRGPEKVVVGQDIVLTGSGYLATDDRTGSVVNFFLDALYSGDPNTIMSRQSFTNPATGKAITDKRTNAVVQAKADGTWTATVKWPTPATVQLTQREIDERFAPGTTHSIRMLTGSLLTSPADRQRGGSQFFTVVNSLDDEVRVTEPIYEHQTFSSDVPGDGAVAWLPSTVDSGASIALSGTGWLTKDKQWGSTVYVRLQDETGAYYQRPATGAALRTTAAAASTGPEDPTVWQVVQAGEDGEVNVSVPMPAEAKAGDFLAVELTSVDDGTSLGDVARHWVSEPLAIDGTPYLPPVSGGATCTAGPTGYSYELAPGMAVPAANIGGTIRLVGHDFCNLVGGGSLVAVKINAGGYSHLNSDTAALYDANQGREVGVCPAGICASNKTIWYVIEADDTGAFDVEIPLPDGTDSTPAFTEGSYTLQLLTRTISADPYYKGTRPDPSRSITTPELTVVAAGVPLDDVKPGRPQAAPDPLHVTQDLTDGARGGVSVDQQATRWVVTVPGAEPGDWVYVNVYDDASPRFPWGATWFPLDEQRRVVLPLAGTALPTGTNKLSVQDRDGGLLGWTRVTVAAPVTPPAPAAPETSGGLVGTGTVVPAGTGAVLPPVRFVPAPVPSGAPRPSTVPEPPVAGYADLDEGNAGGVTGVESDGRLVVTVPGVEGGHWVFVYLYTQTGGVVPAGWVQVGTDHTLTVELGSLPDGIHRLALVGEDGALVGWVTANGPQPLPAEETPGATDDTVAGAPPSGGDALVEDPVLPVAAPSDLTATLVLVGLGVLVLAGAGTGALVLRTPVRPRLRG